MVKNTKKYHKEYIYTANHKELKQIRNVYFYISNKFILIIYLILLIVSILKFSLWIIIVFGLSGIVVFFLIAFIKEETNSDQKEMKVFLIVDDRYIQFKGQLVVWKNIKHIQIVYEDEKQNGNNFFIKIQHCNNKEMFIDTYYYEEQWEVVQGIINIAKLKQVTITTKISSDFPLTKDK